MESNKIAHLNFIENTIQRMSNNSAAIKGWSMGIIGAIIGLGIVGRGSVDNSSSLIIFACACAITIVMWFLDSYYLYQEKCYRVLYSLVRIQKEKEIDFSMDARFKTLLTKNGNPPSYMYCIFNISVIPFYIPQLVINFAFFVLPLIINNFNKG